MSLGVSTFWITRETAAPGAGFSFGRWFWTVDKMLLAFIFALVGCGILAVAVASSAGAQRATTSHFHPDDLYFFKRQILWALAGMPLMLGVSMLPVGWARRLALVGAILFLAALLAVPFIGTGTKGAIRWIQAPGFLFQPSEFFKPMFVVTTAWLLALRFDDPGLPTIQVSFGLLLLVAALLVNQPDFGQTALMLAVWLVQAVLAGMSLWVLAGLTVAALAGLGIAYLTAEHVTGRIDKFLTGGGDTYQIDKALDCFRAGGIFGVGPGNGQAKFHLPEPHTDYIFSVIGEEFGMIACLIIAGLAISIVVRVFLTLFEEDDPFIVLAAGGLATEFGLQASINMAVNLKLLPSKGMTLPFISYGGSSFIAMSIGMGLLLAFTRRNRFLKASPYVDRRWAR